MRDIHSESSERKKPRKTKYEKDLYERDIFEAERKNEKKFRRHQKWIGVFIACLIAAFVLVAALIATLYLNTKHPELTIGTSILRDISILMISSVAALLGLCLAAYTFLNDSLKKRVEDDPTVKETVNIVLSRVKANMFILILVAIFITLCGVVLNIFLGKPWEKIDNIEDIVIKLNSGLWYVFIAYVTVSVFVISWALFVSHQILNSDGMLTKQAKSNLRMHGKALMKQLRRIRAEACCDILDMDKERSTSQNELLDYADREYSFSLAYLNFLNDCKKEIAESKEGGKVVIEKSQVEILKDKLKDIKDKEEKKKEIEDALKIDQLPEDAWWEVYFTQDSAEGGFSKEEDILFGKTVRFIELIVNKICDNNIDKSIMTGDYIYDSMQSGFRYLYAQDVADKTLLDVRDKNRFFDQLKYQIITDKRFQEKPFDNSEVEEIYERVKKLFERTGFALWDDTERQKRREEIQSGISLSKLDDKDPTVYQSEYILKYKADTEKIIERFFLIYKHVIGYRNALVHYDKFKNEKAQTGDLEPYSTVAYLCAEVLKRVLIDRFTSFVKTDQLNLGNSTLDKGWFNYSDLSDSNFTHSSLRFVRVENASARNCDFSTCNFILADASNTDFSGCNFSYSNMTGMELNDCNLNGAQFSYAILRDGRIDSYVGLKLMSEFVRDKKINDYLKNMQEWRESVRKFTYEEENKIMGDWHSGKGIREKILGGIVQGDLKQYCELHDEDTSCSILSEHQANLMYLEKAIRAALGMGDEGCETGFLGYRKYRKISADALKAICAARQEEKFAPNSMRDGKMSTKLRESIFGKVYFGVANLAMATLNEASMEEMDFSHVVMEKASFRDADLSNADMYYTDAEQAMFLKTNLNELDAYHANFEGANFNEASMVGAVLCDCKANSCNFKKAILLKAILMNTPTGSGMKESLYILRFTRQSEKTNQGDIREYLEKSVEEFLDESGTMRKIDDLDNRGYNFKECEFTEAIANEMMVMNLNMMRSNFVGASVRSSLFYNTLLRCCTLSKANFSHAIFIGVSFHQSNLEECNLTHAKLYACDMSNTNLTGANFISTRMEKVIFDESNLKSCNLASAQIRNCTFNKCNFEGAVFDSNTKFINCIFVGIDFSKTIGLSEVVIDNCCIHQEARPNETEEICLTGNEEQNNIYADVVSGMIGLDGGIRRYSTRNADRARR